MLWMRPRVWLPKVVIPACAPVKDMAFSPSSCRAMQSRAMDCCSPVAISTSSSRSQGVSDNSLASPISLSVTPLMAETTATTWLPSLAVSWMRRATLRMRSMVPTELPPNLNDKSHVTG